jgi:hypothetical protein
MALRKPVVIKASEIRAILGPVDDKLVAAIIKTGASRNDVYQVSQWLETGEYKPRMGKFANEAIALVHDILMADRNRFLPDD